MTPFLAGHDTTALTMTWGWYLLARHPELARIIQEEAEQRPGDGASSPLGEPALAIDESA